MRVEQAASAAPLPVKKPRRVWRVLKWLGLGLLGLGVVAFVAGWVWMRGSLPRLEGEVRVAGLKGPVRIIRDTWGIPTLQAGTPEDAFFGVGYVHAQDRFFQLEMQRLVAQGRMSEFAGPPGVETDTFMRRLGLYRRAEAAEKLLQPETRAALEAYAAGVNAWLEANRDALPPEFGLLRVAGRPLSPQPWRAVDSIVWAKMMALSLAYDYRHEMSISEAIEKVGEARAEDLFPPYPASAPTIVGQAGPAPVSAPERMLARAAQGDDALLERLHHLYATLGSTAWGQGSNNWVLGPSRTVSGHPLLANDTHLRAQSPSTFYIARLDAPGLKVVGVTLPGLPVVVFGRNERVAWGATAMHPDTQDLYLEKVDPKDPTHYLAGEQSLPFTTRTESLMVAGQKEPTLITARETRHGPVIEEDWKGRGPLAMRWTALDADDTSIDGFLAMNRASNWSEFRAAAAKLVAPPLNLLYADQEDHIGYVAAGRIPIRAQGKGRLPMNGWEEGWEWTGSIPPEQLPTLFDPPEGYIATANNKVAGEAYPYHIGLQFDHFRVERIRELILSKPKHSLEDMVAMQGDVTSLFARRLLPHLLATPVKGEREKAALETLAAWKGEERGDSAAGAIFQTWYANLMTALLEDDLGPRFQYYLGNSADYLLTALEKPEARWCDDVRTPEAESCEQLQEKALRAGLDELEQRLGKDPAAWRLDRLLTLPLANPIWRGVPVLGPRFSQTVPMSGDPYTLRVSHYSFMEPRYLVHLTSSHSGLFDLAPNGETRLLIPPGQSGHPLSPHFEDLLPRWTENTPPTVALTGEPQGAVLVLNPK